MIKSIDQLDPGKRYTYADYLTWQFQERVELILGKIFRMSPAPKTAHQQVLMKLSSSLYNKLKGNGCQVFPAPFDVRLPIKGSKKNEKIDTVIQPDISVVCDPSKLDEKGCIGAPDLIIEIVSRSSVRKDLHDKYDIYEWAGVKEYWVVHPIDKTVMKYTLHNGKYQPSRLLTLGDVVESDVLKGYSVSLDDTFSGMVGEDDDVEYEKSIRRI